MRKVDALFRSIFVILLLPLLSLPASPAWAATYYIDITNGSDTNDGLSPAEAWQTISKVNTSSFAAGDSILFNRGGIWREQLTIPSSGSPGNPITFAAYGSGVNPKIYRSNSFNNWWELSLIDNGGLESYTIGSPNDSFTSWSVFNNTGNSSVKADHTVAHTVGGTSARLTADGTGQAFGAGDYAQCSQTIANIQNVTTYYLNVWGRVSTPGNNALLLRIKDLGNNRYLDSNGIWQTSSTYCASTWNGAPINTWVQKTITFTTAASGNTSLELEFLNFQTGNAWVDDVYFVQGNAPSSTRIWAGTVNGNTNYWGMIKDGNRTLAHPTYPRVSPFFTADGYFNGPLNSEVFYYRQDSGKPGTVEVGIRERAILVNNQNYITIDGLDCYGPGGSVTGTKQTNECLVDVVGTSDHITVKNGDMSYSSEFGMYAHGNLYGDTSSTTNVSFDNLTVHDCLSTGIYNNATGGSITNSKIYNIGLIVTDSGDSGGIGVQGGNLTISGNEIYNIGRNDACVDFAISICGSLNPLTITRNYLHDLPSSGIQLAEGGNNSVVSYNIIKGFGSSTVDPDTLDPGKYAGIRIGGGNCGATGVIVANNVISGGKQPNNVNHGSISVVSSDTSNLEIVNNVFFNNTNKDIYMEYQSNIRCNNNIYYKSDYTNNWQWQGVACSTFSAWQGMFSMDFNSSTSDPLFSNSTGALSQAPDFIPQSVSPCRDAGTPVGLPQDFCGTPVPASTPDSGAYQITAPPSIFPVSQSFSSDGGSGSINVSAAATYPWSAVSNNSWITISQASATQGNGMVSYSVVANAGTSRLGSITVAGLNFSVRQDATPSPPPIAPPSLSPTSQSFTSDGGSGTINVSADATCSWNALSNDSWITIGQVTANQGNGMVSYSVASNTGASRQGSITVAGQQFMVSQGTAAPPSISPTSQSFTSNGGSGSINVSADATCSWNALSNNSWITIGQVTATQGNGMVSYSVARNTGASRIGLITVAGKTFLINQNAGVANSKKRVLYFNQK